MADECIKDSSRDRSVECLIKTSDVESTEKLTWTVRPGCSLVALTHCSPAQRWKVEHTSPSWQVWHTDWETLTEEWRLPLPENSNKPVQASHQSHSRCRCWSVCFTCSHLVLSVVWAVPVGQVTSVQHEKPAMPQSKSTDQLKHCLEENKTEELTWQNYDYSRCGLWKISGVELWM